MALEQTARTGKAVGTRDRVVGWLAASGDVEDSSGMASTVLAQAIGYPGSSIAFAQLLSGMERSGLIEREIRGKRTYRVSLTEAGRERAVAGRAGSRPAGTRRRPPAGNPAAGRYVPPARRTGAEDDTVDYDELARRLLHQVARRLTADRARLPEDRPMRRGGGERHVDQLEQRLRNLEAELARARAARLTLEEENVELRSQLERIRDNLDGETRRPIRPRATPPADQVDHRDVALLQQMLVERQAGGARRDKADSA